MRALVIGGGIVGVASAHYLRQGGAEVTVVDQHTLDIPKFGAASHGNCGLIAPSHILPLNSRSTLFKGMRSLFSKDAPLKIRARVDLRLWSWLLRFAVASRGEPRMRTAQARAALLASTTELYQQLIEQQQLECEWQSAGCLFVYRDPDAIAEYGEVNRELQQHFQVSAERISGADLGRWEPALRDDLAGAWYYSIDNHLRPDRLLQSWRHRLREQGVVFHEGWPVAELTGRSPNASGVRGPKGELEADVVIVATGAWTPQLGGQLGAHIPIQPGKGYSVTLQPGQLHCQRSLIFQEHKVALTPFQSGTRLGSLMEFAGYDTTLQRRRIDLLRRGANHYLADPLPEFPEGQCDEWYGFRPMTYDGRPIIDRSPRYANVIIAAGHNMIGMTLGPVTGKLVAELATGKKPHIDLTPFRVGRP